MKRLWVILFVLPLFAQNRVVVNTRTERIHLSRVLHLPDSLYQKEYDNKDLAINDGFELCKACFDSRPDIFDYDLEKQLTTQSIIAIKNRYEIMYEHERLESLSDIMSSVLKKWPEPLKGYSYRLQIIRDDSPNALAVAGGNIYLTTGLIDMVENDKELEAVIAHEVAHTERRHTLRSFKAYQRKQLGAKAIALLMTTLSVASGNPNVDALSQITKLLVDYSTILATKGYSRELETEADMFAQLYFQENKFNNKNLLTVFDRLATYTSTRLGYIPVTNAFSDHPSIISRIKQVRDGDFYILKEPLFISLIPVGMLTSPTGPRVMGPPIKAINKLTKKEKSLINSLQNNFITLTIDKYYVAPSTNSAFETEFYLLGKIINNNSDSHFTIKEVTLDFPGKSGKTSLNGFSDVNILANEQTNFISRFSINNKFSEEVAEDINNKNLMSYLVTVSPIEINNKRLISWGPKIACAIVVK